VLHSGPHNLQGAVFTKDKMVGEGQKAELCVHLFNTISGPGDLKRPQERGEAAGGCGVFGRLELEERGA
jgi:hypothetical protein